MQPNGVRVFLEDLYPILYAVNQQDELWRLIVWAKEKKATKAQQLYEARLRDVDRRILSYRINHISMYFAAYEIHNLARLMFPPPKRHRKGAAGGYRLVKGERRTRTYSMMK